MKRKHEEVNYHLIYLLKRHGNFKTYLPHIKLVENSTCFLYLTENDDAEHTLLRCSRWTGKKKVVTDILGDITPGNIVGKMMAQLEWWKAIETFATEVMKQKK